MLKNNIILFILLFIVFKIPSAHSRDFVFTADEISNTISIIDPTSESSVGEIRLGPPRPFITASRPLIFTHINVHGLDLSPDKQTLAITSNLSNSVALLDLKNYSVKANTGVGRGPHISIHSPNGKELWVAVRSESHISVLDANSLKEIRRIPVNFGPSAIIFSKVNSYAFILNVFHPSLEVIDISTYQVVKSIALEGSVSPIGAQSPDGSDIWIVQKDIGKVARIDPINLIVKSYINTGKYTQHVTIGKSINGLNMYATVGGEERVKVYSIKNDSLDLIHNIPVKGIPHGIWSDPEGKKIFVGMEFGDSVAVLHAEKNYAVSKYIPIGKSPQSLVYASNIPEPTVQIPEKTKQPPTKYMALQPTNKTAYPQAVGALSLREARPVDSLQIFISGIPNSVKNVILYIRKADNKKEPLIAFNMSAAGSADFEIVYPSPSSYLRSSVFGSTIEVYDRAKQNKPILSGKFLSKP